MPRRLLLALAVTAVMLLLAEGALSLLFGRSLRGTARTSVRSVVLVDDAAQPEPIRRTEGVYRSHPDPLLGAVLQQSEDLLTMGVPFRADALGIRVRPGPPAPDDALRIVILGDSVAFGSGLTDDETIAAQLERLLHDSRGPDARPIACFTAATPSWNHVDALRFLDDHWSALRPDVLIYLPIENDLTDSTTVIESGLRRVGVDLAQRDPWLQVTYPSGDALFAALSRDSPSQPSFGAVALTSDLGAESRARYDANAASIARMARRAEDNGARFALLHLQEKGWRGEYSWILRERLLEQVPGVLEIPGFVSPPPDCRLEGDAHLNATGNEALALWTAEVLLERGWIDRGAGRPLPAAARVAVRHRAPSRAPHDIRAQAEAARKDMRRKLEPRIDVRTGHGTGQIYGGLNPDGTLTHRLLALLPGGGRSLLVRAQALPGARHLGDLELTIEADGQVLGTLTLPPGEAPAAARLPLPPRSDPDAPLDVKLIASDWFADAFRGRTQLMSCRLLEIAVE